MPQPDALTLWRKCPPLGRDALPVLAERPHRIDSVGGERAAAEVMDKEVVSAASSKPAWCARMAKSPSSKSPSPNRSSSPPIAS